MQNLEKLLGNSARLLYLYEYNKENSMFMNYFNKHFNTVLSLGYTICIGERRYNEVEVYLKNNNERTNGFIIKTR